MIVSTALGEGSGIRTGTAPASITVSDPVSSIGTPEVKTAAHDKLCPRLQMPLCKATCLGEQSSEDLLPSTSIVVAHIDVISYRKIL